jgi:Tol biopolymer transport system component
MIRADGIVKILDFGIAKLAAPLADFVEAEGETVKKVLSRTKPGTLIGTLQYMSPEQVRGRDVDARSDIFSLGVVLYEMLTGEEAFERPTPGDIIAAILTETPSPVSEKNVNATPELERILSKALKKNRDERYQTSRDFLLDIKSLRREIEFSSGDFRLSATGARGTREQAIHETHATTTLRRFSNSAALSIFLLAVLAIGAAFWFFTKNNSPTHVPTLSSAPLPVAEVATWRSTPGEIYTVGSFSQDARFVAFSSTKTGTKSIWVKQLSGGESVQITKDEFANNYPVWSPTGDEIAFHSNRGGAGGIWRMPALGGTPTLLKTVADAGMILRRWSKTNRIYYEADGNLFALDAKTGEANQLTNFDAKEKPVSITISPDEKQIAYVAFENEQYKIFTMPASGGEAKQIFSSADEMRNAVWHADNKRILYSQAVGGTFQIFAVDANGDGNQKPAQVTFGDADALALDVSSDGEKILYGASKEESDVWGVNVEKAEEFSVAADINSELWAAPAPDGKTVAYQSIKNLSQGDKLFGGAVLAKTISSDSAPVQITASGGLPVWSPDGKRVAFLRQSGEEYNLWTTGASGGEKQLTTDGLPSVEFTTLPYNRIQASYYSWSPDSQKIAYVSERGGIKNISLVNADGADDLPLTNNFDSNLSFYCPLWSSDGTRVAYASKSQKSVAGEKIFYATSVVDAQTKNSKIVAQAENFQRLLGWSMSGKELIFAAINSKSPKGSPTEVSIIEANVESGEQRQIAKLDAAYLYNVCLSADKKMLAYVSNKDGKDNVFLLRPGNGGEARRLTANMDARLYFSALSFSPDNRTIYFGKQARYSLLSMVTNFK